MKIKPDGKSKDPLKVFMVVLVAALVVFAGAFVYLGAELLKSRRAEKKETPSAAGTEEPSIAPVAEEETEKPSSGEAEIDRRNLRRIWIGDSRMVGMQRACEGLSVQDLFIAKGEMYFEWLRDVAVPTIEPMLSTGEAYNVIIEMGVNDSANNTKGWKDFTVADYIEALNVLVDKYPKTRFFFLSVGRTVGDYKGTEWIPPSVLTPAINYFNARMHGECRAIYLAAGEYLYRANLPYADGVHYAASTNRAIYEYVLERLNLNESEPFTAFPE